MKFILGKKLEMTQVFKADGTVVPVTAVLVTPNVITQIKSLEKDGYSAVQIGFDQAKKMKKSQKGHLNGLSEVRTMREFRVDVKEIGEIKRGDQLTAEIFEIGDGVKVTGFSKGKGFQGVVKRHGFHGQDSTHGHKDQSRMPGSIGAGGVQRVFKGVRMAGHMGNAQITVSGLEIVEIDSEKNLLYVKGAVPGGRNGLLLISGPGEIKIVAPAVEPEAVVENVEVEAATEEVKTEIVAEEIVSAEETKTEAPVENTDEQPEANKE